MSRALYWLSGFAPLWLGAILLALEALHELSEATERQATR